MVNLELLRKYAMIHPKKRNYFLVCHSSYSYYQHKFHQHTISVERYNELAD